METLFQVSGQESYGDLHLENLIQLFDERIEAYRRAGSLKERVSASFARYSQQRTLRIPKHNKLPAAPIVGAKAIDRNAATLGFVDYVAIRLCVGADGYSS